jgi:pimeloyl-ACP methyl ester carboxylesterase
MKANTQMKFRSLMKTVALCGFATCMWPMGAAAAGLDTWNVQSVPPSFPHDSGAITGIAYSNGIYVAVGLVWADNFGYVLRSTDNGASWKEVSNPTGNLANPLPQLSGVAFHGNSFVAVGQSGKSWTSPDGLLWTPHAVYPGYTGVLHNLRFLNNQFVALPLGANIATSPDGIIWTFFPSPPDLNSQSSFADVTYGLGKYVLANPGNSFTTDGVNLLPGVGDAGGGNAVAFGMVNGTTPLFISLYAQNYVISSDGVNWKNPSTPTTSPPFTTSPFNNELPITAITFSPEANTFVAGGTPITSGAGVYWTTDGITWGSGFIPNASGIRTIRYVNGSFFATGDNYIIAQSGAIGTPTPSPTPAPTPTPPSTPPTFSPAILDNNRISVTFRNLNFNSGKGTTTGVKVASSAFQTKEKQSLHISVSDAVPSGDTDIRVDLCDSRGVPIPAILKASEREPKPKSGQMLQAFVFNTIADQPAGNYSIRIEAMNTKNSLYSPLVTVSGGYNWGVMTETSSSKAHHICVYSVPLNTAGTPRINQIASWVVIHGRTSSPSDDYIQNLALTLSKSAPKVGQVLAVDWQTAAYDNNITLNDWIGFLDEGSRWIPYVAKFASDTLTHSGVVGSNLNIAGHSWGSYIGQQIGRNLMGSSPSAAPLISRLIALDPAVVGAENTTDAQKQSWVLGVAPGYFKNVALSSWAFYSSALGSLDNAKTAADTFVILNQWDPFVAYKSLKDEKIIWAADFSNTPALDIPLQVDQLIEAHKAAPQAWTLMLLHFLNHTGNPTVQEIGAKFAIDQNWIQNRVTIDNDGIALRPAKKTDPKFDTKYPLEAVLSVDGLDEALRLVPNP